MTDYKQEYMCHVTVMAPPLPPPIWLLNILTVMILLLVVLSGFVSRLVSAVDCGCSAYSDTFDTFVECFSKNSQVYAKCKAPLVWTNYVRGSLARDEELTLLDSMESDGTQFGGILAESYCSLFSNSSITLCGTGCSPLPNDYDTNWQVLYHPNSPNADLMGAPIIANLAYPATVTCREGYAQAVGSSTVSSVSCSQSGWNPSNLTLLITCSPGCPTPSITHGVVTPESRGIAGAAPYTVGNLVKVSCGDGFVLAGGDSLTCTALMRWKPAVPPKCVTRTSTVSEAGVKTLNVFVFLLVMLGTMISSSCLDVSL